MNDFDLAWMKKSSAAHEVARNTLIKRLRNELEIKDPHGAFWETFDPSHGPTRAKKKKTTQPEDSEDADLLRLTLEYFKRQFLLSTPKTVKAAKMEALAASLQQCIRHLERIAFQGDPNAIEAFVNLTLWSVANLNSLAAKHREIILPLSRRCLSWPARISKIKAFRDDADELIRKLEVGKETIANDSAARFNPGKKFGKVAWDFIQRIEHARDAAPLMHNIRFPAGWEMNAEKLSPFNRKATPEEKKKWRAVVKEVLELDFGDPKKAKSYQRLITAKSHKNRWKAVFKNKIDGELDSLWQLHRKSKR